MADVCAFTDDNPFAGRHVIIDLWGAQNLTNTKAIEECLVAAAEKAGATVLFSKMHHFGGDYGVTGVIALAESHISIHTWPERNFAAIDIFMCGNCNPLDGYDIITAFFRPEKADVTSMLRGVSVE